MVDRATQVPRTQCVDVETSTVEPSNLDLALPPFLHGIGQSIDDLVLDFKDLRHLKWHKTQMARNINSGTQLVLYGHAHTIATTTHRGR